MLAVVGNPFEDKRPLVLHGSDVALAHDGSIGFAVTSGARTGLCQPNSGGRGKQLAISISAVFRHDLRHTASEKMA
jgi:hypothetical protein